MIEDAGTTAGEATETKRKAKAKSKGKAAKVKGKKGKKAAAGNGRTRTGVGATIKTIILKKPDRPNKEIAEMALKAHPDSSTNAACVAWYKNDMRKKGELKKSKK
jgi:hypothetical protein